MKHGAFTFALLLAAGVAGGVAFVGCSSSDEAAPAPTDSGVAADSAPVDTGATKDTAPPVDTGLVPCEAKLDKAFACEEPAVKAGKTVCTDVMINEFMNCFGTDGDSKKCTAAQTKYPQCNTCILTDWLADSRIDVAGCVKKIDPTGTCGKTIGCTQACLDMTCSSDECDDTPGSGSTSTRSQLDDCYRAVQQKPGSSIRPTGQCWDVAVKDYAACSGDAKFTYCFVRAKTDLLTFYRGACRDNGSWAKADQPDGSEDAGVTDTGATDTGAADTAVADTAVADTAVADVAVDVATGG